MLSASSLNVNRKLRRVLVLFPGSLGDVICALPAFTSLCRSSTEKITLATRGEAFDFCTLFLASYADVISLEGATFSQLFLNPQHILLSEKFFQLFSHFSTIFSWYGHEKSEVRENLLRFSSADVQSFPFFTGQEDWHAVFYYLSCIGKKTMRCPSLSLPEDMRRWGESFFRQYSKKIFSPTLVIHPGSGGKRKRWDPKGFLQVGRWWQKTRHGNVLTLLGPAEENELLQWRSMGEVASKLSLLQISALLSQADFYLGNDSGVSHLAGAVGARGVVLFGPTLPQQWRPLGGNLSIIRNSIYRGNFPARDGISLEEITVGEVIANLILIGG